MEYCWQTAEPMVSGIHTKEVCRLIDKAIEDYRNGESTFLVVKMPFRHGKSQMLSRFLPPHFLGEFPDSEVMLVTYASSLAETFSRYARSILTSPEYKELYPDIRIDKKNSGVQEWGIEGHVGHCTASGLTSGITGKGYHLGLLDDYCASRSDAESETIRNSSWEHFTNDFLTRRAPVSITIVLATPWHVDDIIGRIERKINPDNEEFDKDFPPFKVVSFPAVNGEVEVGEDETTFCKTKKVKYKTLFPERFNDTWYKQQFASLGTYASSALLQCNPVSRGGNVFNMKGIHIHDSLSEFPNIRYDRIWDLAHTEKQVNKNDPDYTSGTLVGYRKINNAWEIWIKDVARIRANAPERDRFIRACTDKDGYGVAVGIENSVESKDAINVMKDILMGKRSLIPINIKDDKIVRGSYLEPIFEAGNIHILRGSWNFDWLQEFNQFPSGKHDDQVDNVTAGYYLRCKSSGDIQSSNVYGV